MSGQWRSVQTVVEEVPVLDRYKLWIDKVTMTTDQCTMKLEANVARIRFYLDDP